MLGDYSQGAWLTPSPVGLASLPQEQLHARVKVPQDSCVVATLASVLCPVSSEGTSPPFSGRSYSGLRVTSTTSVLIPGWAGPLGHMFAQHPPFSLKRSA